MEKEKGNIFIPSVAIVFLLVVWGVVSPATFAVAAKESFRFLTHNLGWFYQLTVNVVTVFILYIACSRFGKLKLGPEDSQPEFKTFSWLGMLFSSALGIGICFFGAAEPATYFIKPSLGADPGSLQAARDAIMIYGLHKGPALWCTYLIMGIGIGYFQQRHNCKGLVSSIFLPILGEEKVNGPIGKFIDILVIFASAAGISTSLGMAALQFNSGLNYVFGLPNEVFAQIVIILAFVLVYGGTAVFGVKSGIKFISDVNSYLCFFIMGALFLLGPTLKIIGTFMTVAGDLVNNYPSLVLAVKPFDAAYTKWLGSWSQFYWAWDITWAPFVGSFYARISRGRTIRQTVFGVLSAPMICSMIWGCVFGSCVFELELIKGISICPAILKDTSVGVFELLMNYPFITNLPIGLVLSFVMTILLSTFFITSANSGTYVLAMYTSKGDQNPPKVRIATWAILIGLLAIVLLVAGGLKSLQTISFVAAPPVAVILILSCYSLYKAMVQEEKEGKLVFKK